MDVLPLVVTLQLQFWHSLFCFLHCCAFIGPSAGNFGFTVFAFGATVDVVTSVSIFVGGIWVLKHFALYISSRSFLDFSTLANLSYASFWILKYCFSDFIYLFSICLSNIHISFLYFISGSNFPFLCNIFLVRLNYLKIVNPHT